MQGAYIHIPFCKKACHYCDFHFSTSLQHKTPLLQALQKEIALRKNYLPSPTLHTLYFGGGTPSLLEKEELAALLNTFAHYYSIAPGAEITLEANPDDITPQKVKEWEQLGINRLSIGIQSFFEEDLAWMNRAHNAAQADTCIDIALQSGITNITADLIYGYPLLTDKKWEQNIHRLLSSGAQHLSAYGLTVEPKTALAHQVKKGQTPMPDNEQAARHFEMLQDAIEQKGWEHYEISNYCAPGRYALHNTNYWKNQPYIGIGPSAHSYNGAARQYNLANNAGYITAIGQNILPAEEELLNAGNRFNETIMTGLRTQWGINLEAVGQQLGESFKTHLETSIGPFIEQGLLKKNAETIFLTRPGKLLADYISAELFVV